MARLSTAKAQPPGSHEFVAEIEIDRPASEVYPLLDFADPRHAKRQLGDKVEACAGDPEKFALVASELPDAVFYFTVSAQVRDREYACWCVSTPTFGAVARTHEHYRLEDLGPAGCRLVLTNTVEFQDGLSDEDYAVEALLQPFACFSAIEKIKIHAEEGVEAVRELSAAMAEALDALECGDD